MVLEQLVPGEYGPRMLHQKGEQLEFLQGEGDFPPVGQHLMAGRIDAQWAQSKGRGPAPPPPPLWRRAVRMRAISSIMPKGLAM